MSVREKVIPVRGKSQWECARVELGLSRMRISVAGGESAKHDHGEVGYEVVREEGGPGNAGPPSQLGSGGGALTYAE